MSDEYNEREMRLIDERDAALGRAESAERELEDWCAEFGVGWHEGMPQEELARLTTKLEGVETDKQLFSRQLGEALGELRLANAELDAIKAERDQVQRHYDELSKLAHKIADKGSARMNVLEDALREALDHWGASARLAEYGGARVQAERDRIAELRTLLG